MANARDWLRRSLVAALVAAPMLGCAPRHERPTPYTAPPSTAATGTGSSVADAGAPPDARVDEASPSCSAAPTATTGAASPPPVPRGAWEVERHFLGCVWQALPAPLRLEFHATGTSVSLRWGSNASSGPIDLAGGRVSFTGFVRESAVGASDEERRSAALVLAALQRARGFHFDRGACDSGPYCVVMVDADRVPLLALAGAAVDDPRRLRDVSPASLDAAAPLSQHACSRIAGAEPIGAGSLTGDWEVRRHYAGCVWSALPAPATLRFAPDTKTAVAAIGAAEPVELQRLTYRAPSTEVEQVGTLAENRTLLLLDFALRNAHEVASRGPCRALTLGTVPLLELAPKGFTGECPKP